MVIGITPFGVPDARLAAAVSRAGGLGILDLGRGDAAAREALARLRRWAPGSFGVRVGAECAMGRDDVAGVSTVVLGAGVPWTDAPASCRVLREVTDLDEAHEARAAGAHGLIARGHECGGRVGALSTFVLLQRLLGDEGPGLPVWACGGIGEHTAAAAVAGGAAGVVLDAQLALLEESALPEGAAAPLRRMDGTETVVVGGHRVLRRRGPDAPSLDGADEDADADIVGRLGVDDPRRQLLPVGQDGFLAAEFAERHGTVAEAVGAVRAAIAEAFHDDAAGEALRPGSPAALALGTRLPVVQGPMTRVSDQPGFAASVAAAGGLPVLALALADGARTAALLASTRAAVGDAPWGVGLLGFAQESVRAAQLAAVLAERPTHAVIAGGRPSQAKALEEAGIATFLHVPSPGLLRQFLAAGSRRFVFEGAECGGHVGPRASFPLWQAQLSVLEAFLAEEGAAAEGLQVLFAGGVHDARSAAMVAAMAAPLTRRGVAVGVLMGTAYLFTAEAVAHGAIGPEFQRRVVAARATELLVTAPGHATRCVESPFTAEFRAAEAELRAGDVPEREAWERLEQLNLGRLRIASKGVERVGEDLVAVDDQRQRAAGMFMAGDVAVLRSATTTVAELHHAVGPAAADFLAGRAVTLRGRPHAADLPDPAPLEIAIVGMAGMFPGARDLDEFWANVLDGVDAVSEVPAERWDPELYYAPEGGEGATTVSKWGGFLPRIPFDPLAYGIPPASLAGIEPVQLLALEATRRALADAGYDRRPFPRARTSVIFGAEAGSDLSTALTLRTVLPGFTGPLPDALGDQLPTLTEDSFPGMLANVIAGRIANRLDLGGANYTVDAACASSLAALDAACKDLATGAADVALCGGADLHNGIHDYVLFSSVHALSPTGRSRTFDAGADGIALGEGVACVVLKRLADARRDGDRVYAVVQGVGAASDGRHLGLTAPRAEGQRAALERAYHQAGIAPAEVQLIEAHGTGTVVGDRTELTVLTEMLTDAGARPGGCALGSVKSQIGHTKCAAGLAGLIKTALALHTGILPPTGNLVSPNPAWDQETSPFAFHTGPRPWATPAAERVAGVSAFGFGGTNFHAVLTAHPAGPPPTTSRAVWPAELLTFRTARAAEELLRSLESTGSAPTPLRELARSAAVEADARPGRVAVAVVAESLDDLPGLLRRAIAGENDPAAGVFVAAREGEGEGDPADVAFLFPGQGSQRPGMFAELFTAFPELHRYLELGAAPVDAVFPPASFDDATRERRRAAVTDTRVAQPALGLTALAAHDLLTRAGVRPAMAGGHSYGELAALCAAGALTPDALLALSADRAEAILASIGDDPGTMAAVPADAGTVDEVLRLGGLDGRVTAANHNSPTQTVISGATDAIDEAVRLLTDAGHRPKRLPVACAFHSPLLAGAGERFAAALAHHPLRAPEFPVWANRTAAPYPAGPDAIRAELAAQLGAEVRFVAQIEAMYAAGARVFVEAGPGAALTGLVGKILGDRPHHAVACEPRPGAGLRGFLDALARLAVAGVPVRTAWLHHGRPAAPSPARPAGWTVDGHLVRTAAGDPLPGGLHPARRVPLTPLENNAMPQPDPDALLVEYLRTTRELVAAQRDVLLTYLGGAPAPAAPAAPARLPELPALPGLAEPPAAVADAGVRAAAHASIPAAGGTEGAGPVGPDADAAAATAPDVTGTVLRVISERTGYPVDMLDPDLDLEADLSIDSIKRTEIAGELVTALGGSAATSDVAEAELEELSRSRTVASIADWLSAKLTGPGEPTSAAPGEAHIPAQRTSGPGEPAAAVDGAEGLAGVAPRRLVLREVPLTAAESGQAGGSGGAIAGKRFALLGGDAVADALAAGLERHGARVTRHGAAHALADADGPVDGVVLLGPLTDRGEATALPESFGTLKAALARSPRWLLCARPADARAGGLHGLFRTVAREYPGTLARVVALDPAQPAAAAEALLDELTAPDRSPVVLRSGAARTGFELAEAGLGASAGRGAGPAGEGAAEAAALGLDRESVVVLAGGARGIAAHIATALAAACGCRIELLGRTRPFNGPEDADTAGSGDRAALRAALAARGGLSPAEIDRRAGLILAQREIEGTLAELRRLGSPAHYQAVDMRDHESVTQAVKDIRARFDRVDGVVYAAGVIEDRLIAEKEEGAFRRVFGTKVDGARTLLDAVGAGFEGPSFAVLFGSISAVLGNRGQCDYAAANDALEGVGAEWAARTERRALTVHWGPWAPAGAHPGMVTPELGRDYARRGIELIAPHEGAQALLRELAWGDVPAGGSVVLTASGW
ncbi:SDR family NAD(P)-dependent oxidoreductase [Streptomyces radicis]|uniref:SDR family NAD(P)-dependent oxidoreductase n=1 Tax=Streptomyces radicis TaxID=1750517 RepID=A0A3A9W7T7_9ACTN|nr:SDR family NAD(P)-dependent oxidoreductase [Streptomyces radicis]RKN21657.1 SDR family NAD(P)-dependent oxidoreductase [Streptomyces radicis]